MASVGARLPGAADLRVDPDTGVPLPTWDEALDALDADPDAVPAHVVRFGDQDDMQGLLAGTDEADRAVRYLCRYLTKAIATTYDNGDDVSPARAAHIDRLAEEVRWLPCAPTCANWLRFGIQPKGAGPGLVPGHCKHKAHDRSNLGLGGRRVLVSRKRAGVVATCGDSRNRWSGRVSRVDECCRIPSDAGSLVPMAPDVAALAG